MRQIAMLTLAVMACTVVQDGQLRAMQAPQPEKTAIVLIASRQAAAENRFDASEVLMIEGSQNRITWRFVHGPSPADHYQGEVVGSGRQLLEAFEEIERIERTRIQSRTDSIESQSYFTLVLINDHGVRMCVSLNREQGRVLTGGKATRDVFQSIRKVVFGRGYLIHDLLFTSDDGQPANAGPFGRTRYQPSDDKKE